MSIQTSHLDRQKIRFRMVRSQSLETWFEFERMMNTSWLYHDQAMDGVVLTDRDLEDAFRGTQGRHYCEEKLYKHIRKVHNGILTVRRLAKSHEGPLDLADIKAFHACLCDDDDPAAGRYRKSEGPMIPYTHEVTRTPSISYRLRKFVDHLETIYADMHPVEAAALMHHELMSVWPFDERSATAARFLMNFHLLRAGFPPAIIHASLRQEYYNALSGPPEAMVHVVQKALSATFHSAQVFFQNAPQYVPMRRVA